MPDPDPATGDAPPATGGARWPGLRLAFATFTVLPVPTGRLDRAVAGRAMTLAPLVGALLGAVLGGVAIAVRAAHPPVLLLGAAVVGTGALLTRGLHLDGLADTVDALGSYGDRERALKIMKSPEVGPFGVAALVLCLLVQAASVDGIAHRAALPALAGIVTAEATGRLAVAWATRRGVPSARPDGMGALVAGTVGVPGALAGLLALLAVALAAVPGRPWQGPVAVVGSLLVATVVLRHTVRRVGGITGDVLGAQVEISSTIAYLILALAATR